jgi:hypothetical protein
MILKLMENGFIEVLYNWVDEIPLSRPKRNIARDFADGGIGFISSNSGDC